MSTRFQKYINNRIANHKIISLPETHMLEAIDRFGIKIPTQLVYVDDDKFELYNAIINSNVNPSRFSFIDSGKEIRHCLKEILPCDEKIIRQLDSLFVESPDGTNIIFDTYFAKYLDLHNLLNRINSEIDNLNLDKNKLTIVVASPYTGHIVRYAFQQAVGNVLYIEPNNETVNAKGRIEISRSLTATHVGASAPMDSVLGLILNKQNIYVPLTEETLDSSFYKNTSWRDLLGDFAILSDSDVVINGTPCRLIKATPYIDAFGNVFINVFSVLDNHGINKIIEGPALTHQDSLSKQKNKDEKGQNANNCPVKNKSSEPTEKKTVNNHNSKLAPKKRRDGSYIQNTDTDNEIVLFDKSSILWKKVEQKIPEMQISEIDRIIKRINGVFEAICSCDRIVTDTNLWMTEYPIGSHRMAFLKLIEYIISKFNPKRDQVFEIVPEVYEELNKHDKNGTAASHKAKDVIANLLAKDLVDLQGLTFEQHKNAYADIPIGDHIMDLLSHNVKFAVLTNDVDASIRWRQNIKEAIIKKGRNSMPPMMLCKNLQKLFEMRGKLIARKKEIKTITK